MLRRRLAALAAALVALPLLAVASTPQVTAAAPVPLGPAGPEYRVTLLTGDVVTVAIGPGGPPVTTVDPAPRADGTPVSFTTLVDGDDVFVYPSDALPRVQSGVLDEDLFNVALMARTGLHDAATAELPVLVRWQDRPGTARAAPLPGTTTTALLPAADLQPVRVERDRAEELWAAVAPAAPGAIAPASAGSDIAKIVLDTPLRITLDQSVPLVGAPEAWQAGWDGTGVTVGVLDSGVDATHPDLAGKVVDAVDFTGEDDPTDLNGHGTHVASTIAGTGAASGGERRGVAPGATLLVGKVCGADGFCPTSSIMAGMEWLAGRVPVVNMSLGGGPTDGTDELSQLVDTLTAETGTLFVISAGNFGCAPCVAEPGAASSALTVGATDKSDQLADFSSRGPRLGDAAVKPEIVAPGVQISAARAGGEDYVAFSGTSMAAPHVAGAAALLAQAYPAATAPQLKDVLVSTAADLGLRWYEQGAGRLDVPGALSGLSGPSTVVVGRTSDPVTRTLTYANETDRPVTLPLSLAVHGWTGAAAPDGSATLSATTLTVPAGGTATVELTVDPDTAGLGAFGGVVRAGELRTLVSWYTPYPEQPTHPLTVRTVDPQGAVTPSGFPLIMRDAPSNEDTPNDPFRVPQVFFFPVPVDGGREWVAQVPSGTYQVVSQHSQVGLDQRRWYGLARSNVAVAGPTDVTLDTREAVPATARTPEPGWEYDHQLSLSVNVPPEFSGTVFFGTRGWQGFELFATPAPPADRGSIVVQELYTIGEPTVRLRGRGRQLTAEFEPFQVARDLPGSRTLPLVFAGAGTPEDLARVDVRGKAVLVRLPAPTQPDGWTNFFQAQRAATTAAADAAEAGAVLVVPYLDQPGATPISAPSRKGPSGGAAVPMMSVSHVDGERLRGVARIVLSTKRNPEHLYNLHYASGNGVSGNLTHTVRPRDLTRIRTDYHADVPGLGLAHWWTAFRTESGGGWVNPRIWLQAPARVDQYLGPVRDDQRWRRDNALGDRDSNGSTQIDFSAGRGVSREDWFAGPITMIETDDGRGGFLRFQAGDEDVFRASPFLGDSTYGHLVDVDFGLVFPFHYRMFRSDGSKLPARQFPGSHTPHFLLPPEPADYRLEGTFILPASNRFSPSEPVRRMSPRVENVWTFRSQRPSGAGCPVLPGVPCATPPLVQLRYDLGVDLENEAKAGRLHVVRVTPSSPAGQIRGLTMSYSTDEGATWRTAPVIRLGDTHLAVLWHPPLARTGGYVWLRTEAWDAAGNRVEQTVHRAYGLT